MMVMVMMMKVIMLVFKTSVCRKVTPTQHTECPNTLFCLSSILPVRPHRSRGRTTMRTMIKWKRSRKHPRKIHVTSSCTMMLHVFFFSFHRLISTSFRLQTFRVMGGHEMLDLEEWGMVREYNVFLSWRGNGIYRSFYLYFSIFGER